jgi:copper chaperone CopZ
MNTNKKQIDLSIPSMQSTHCQNRVGNKVSKIKGVEIQNLE